MNILCGALFIDGSRSVFYGFMDIIEKSALLDNLIVLYVCICTSMLPLLLVVIVHPKAISYFRLQCILEAFIDVLNFIIFPAFRVWCSFDNDQ